MHRHIIVFLSFGAFFTYSMVIVNPGPKYTPTKGEVWPKPQYEKKGDTYFAFDPSHFKVQVTDNNCDILSNAVNRFIYAVAQVTRQSGLFRNRRRRDRLRPRHRRNNMDGLYLGRVHRLEITLTTPCENYPHLDMDESYNLTVAATTKLISASVWGVVRGLETFAQLFYVSNSGNEVFLNSTEIKDFPRYKHRGLLLDTSRHYISLSNILKTLDAMAMNKMNVFHWHIIDDQSFPYQSENFPEISDLGAFDSSMIYNKEDIQRVIEYARNRGIRVVPEFDVPGHTRSWGVAYPNILTECYKDNKMVGLGPMDPTKNVTYKLIRDLFNEVQALFPDKYFHVGGDEVQLDCWESNPELQQYMEEHNLVAKELHSLFMRNVIPLLINGSKPIVWQEVYDEGVPLSQDTLIQVWKYMWIPEMVTILSSGHELLFSSSWYLDNLKLEWKDLYTADPRQMVFDETKNDTLLQGIVGGEACMWGEMVDDRNVINRVWPRASAVAERLWSAGLSDYKTIPTESYNRLEEHTCRMIRRGVDANPASGPGFCIA